MIPWKKDLVNGQVFDKILHWIFKHTFCFIGILLVYKVVTGATDGIGREYVKQLAGKGINIVLISRSLLKLNEFASEIGLSSIKKNLWNYLFIVKNIICS